MQLRNFLVADELAPNASHAIARTRSGPHCSAAHTIRPKEALVLASWSSFVVCCLLLLLLSLVEFYQRVTSLSLLPTTLLTRSLSHTQMVA